MATRYIDEFRRDAVHLNDHKRPLIWGWAFDADKTSLKASP